jgi:hypothetical protein
VAVAAVLLAGVAGWAEEAAAVEDEPAAGQGVLVFAEGGLAHRLDEADLRQRVRLRVAVLAAEAQADRHT